ncbi:MAG: hypothetical protein ABI670_15655 [Chloroflexota bacterium]
MIFVIVPLGKAAPQVINWLWRVFMYTAGSTVGAALLALLLGYVGLGLHRVLPWFTNTWAVVVLGVAALIFALKELNIVKLPALQIGWQVPASWMRPSRVLGNTLYGIVLGAGIFTFIPFASFYLLLMWEIAAGAVSLQSAVLLGMIYGAARGATAILGGISVLRGAYPVDLSQWLIGHLGWWHAVNAFVLLLIAGLLLGSFII